MEQKFIVQVHVGDKWKSVFNDTDKAKAQNTYKASVSEFGGHAVRVLKSDGTKDDGKIKWVIAKAPQEPEIDIEEDELDTNEAEKSIALDQSNDLKTAYRQLIINGVIAFPAVSAASYSFAISSPFTRDITYLLVCGAIIGSIAAFYATLKNLREIHVLVGFRKLYSNNVNRIYAFNKGKGRNVSRNFIAYGLLPFAVFSLAPLPVAVSVKVGSALAAESGYSFQTGTFDRNSCQGDWRKCKTQEQLISQYHGIGAAKDMCLDEFQNIVAHTADPPWLFFGGYLVKEQSFKTGNITLVEPKMGDKNREGYFQVRCSYNLQANKVNGMPRVCLPGKLRC